MDKLLTTSKVANMLNLHINTVRRWSNKGLIKTYRIGPRGDRRFSKEDVINFLKGEGGAASRDKCLSQVSNIKN